MDETLRASVLESWRPIPKPCGFHSGLASNLPFRSGKPKYRFTIGAGCRTRACRGSPTTCRHKPVTVILTSGRWRGLWKRFLSRKGTFMKGVGLGGPSRPGYSYAEEFAGH